MAWPSRGSLSVHGTLVSLLQQSKVRHNEGLNGLNGLKDSARPLLLLLVVSRVSEGIESVMEMKGPSQGESDYPRCMDGCMDTN